MSSLPRTAWIAVATMCALAVSSLSAPASALNIATQPGVMSTMIQPAVLSFDLNGATADDTVAADTQTDTPATGSDQPAQPVSDLATLVAQNLDGDSADRQIQCLAGAVYFEAKSEPLEGQLAVAQVVMNRAASGRFPESICGVVLQPSQFGFVRRGAVPPVSHDSVSWKRAAAIARIAMNELWKPVAPKSLYFHAARVSPRWASAVRVASIGNHIFYR